MSSAPLAELPSSPRAAPKDAPRGNRARAQESVCGLEKNITQREARAASRRRRGRREISPAGRASWGARAAARAARAWLDVGKNPPAYAVVPCHEEPMPAVQAKQWLSKLMGWSSHASVRVPSKTDAPAGGRRPDARADPTAATPSPPRAPASTPRAFCACRRSGCGADRAPPASCAPSPPSPPPAPS